MNHVSLMGNLTRDPEVRFTPKGQPVCEFTVAVTERWKTEAGEQKERTAFIGCVCWGPRGEAFAKHHRKGQRALVEGKLVQETWDDKDTGKKREKTKVQVEQWHWVNPPQEQGAESRYKRSVTGTPQKPLEPAPSTATEPPPEDDDVPF